MSVGPYIEETKPRMPLAA